MSTPILRISCEVTLPLPEPREATFCCETFLADQVQWSHRLLPRVARSDLFSVTLFGLDNWNETVAYSPDDVPSWVPRPPEGWDAPVLAAIEAQAAVAL